MLTKSGVDALTEALLNYPPERPRGRRFAPLAHRGSWSYTDLGRSMLAMPYCVLYLGPGHLKPAAVDKLVAMTALTTDTAAPEFIELTARAKLLNVCGTLATHLTNCLQGELSLTDIDAITTSTKLVRNNFRALTFKEKDANRPNIHIGLHLPETARRFGTLINASCSAGEERHKLAKRAVPHTSYKHDPIAQLMMKTNIDRAMAILHVANPAVGNTFLHDMVTDYLRLHVPILYAPLAQVAAQSRGVDVHLALAKLIDRKTCGRRQLPTTKDAAFTTNLLTAYRTGYQRNLVDISGSSVQWADALGGATDGLGYVLKTGDVLSVGQPSQLVKITAVCCHVHAGKESFFALVQELQPELLGNRAPHPMLDQVYRSAASSPLRLCAIPSLFCPDTRPLLQHMVRAPARAVTHPFTAPLAIFERNDGRATGPGDLAYAVSLASELYFANRWRAQFH